MLLVCAESHDALDARAVVPGPVEQDQFMRRITLEVPLGLLALGRRAQGHDLTYAWVQAFGDALYDTALTGSARHTPRR